MSGPLFNIQTNVELLKELDDVVALMAPYNVDLLRSLRSLDAIDVEQEELLDRYEAISWLLGK
ncbi:hypothetical protein [Corynebacterium cystitidis]|uniref:hypothetical protein n=1 Tax=Corynebacterium cystitidis TaxID=35757 RepID=UPI00211DAFDF|nr:hypothetical protein [Corynebacterium cystitidis]